jgi:hypothetical protein
MQTDEHHVYQDALTAQSLRNGMAMNCTTVNAGTSKVAKTPATSPGVMHTASAADVTALFLAARKASSEAPAGRWRQWTKTLFCMDGPQNVFGQCVRTWWCGLGQFWGVENAKYKQKPQ